MGDPWRFQGRRYDPETGFYYFRVRYLDPEQGRFVNRDPLGIWGDAGNLGNGYAFAGNDPVNRVDPWGLTGGEIIAAGGGAAKITLDTVLAKLAAGASLAELTPAELALFEAAQAAQVEAAAAATATTTTPE